MEAGLGNQGQATSCADPGLGHPGLGHPAFDPVRPWLERLPRQGWPSHEQLSALAAGADLRTESGKPLQFVPPAPADSCYELHVHRTGEVHTRPRNWHDLLNALAWLAFPLTKARLNALHAATMPCEGGRRGRLRDMLTIFDEGGAIVVCDDPDLEAMIRGFRWRELFWEQRARAAARLRVLVLGHAVLEQALAPRPAITCKTLFVSAAQAADRQAAAALAAHATPRSLAPLPIFGLPGWDPGNASETFYADERYFRRPGKNGT